MRVAIIDLGTNTFNIFIADVLPDKTFVKIYKSKISVKLGEGGINRNFIEKEPFGRGIRALKQHKRTIEKFGAEKIFAFATSAIRGATNRNDFIKVAKEKTGIDIQVISGDEEAELIYYGVRSAVKMNETPSLIMDVGGGSTEFIIADKNEILWKQSFLLGVARLLEKFNPSDPIKEREIKELENYFEKNLQPLLEAVNKFSIHEMIGSSGSFDSFAEIIAQRFYDKDILKGKTEYKFNLDDFKKVYLSLISSTKRERMKIKGLSKMRVDTIVLASVFVNYILNRFNITKMRLSKYALREGALWKLLH
jgi:exopolyphosphatase/guanosine-5'-triphosphate,3'-diphosphate pyrophosphatase